MIKKTYSLNDPVWIHGISPNNKLTEGTVIALVDLKSCGYTEIHYVIEIPTHIEPLLEIRTWRTMSQDHEGPIGSLRELGETLSADNKKIRQTGYVYSEDVQCDDLDPTPEQIMAALEKRADELKHKPLQIKEPARKRKYYPRKKKHDSL
jgi:hypothetical protein